MHHRTTAVLLALVAVTGVYAVPLSTTSLGKPLATVKLTKTEIIADKSFRDDVVALETMRGKALTADERSAYLNDVINDILFNQMCERDGVKVSDGEVDGYITRLRAQRPAGETDAQFAAFLATQGIPLDKLKEYYKKQFLVQRWLAKYRAKEIESMPKVQMSEILETYDLYKARLVRPDTVRLSFLYFPYKDKTAAESEKARTTMADLSKRLEGGESFDALRLKSQAGGYVANKEPIYFEKSDVFRSQFGSEFFDTVFSLRDGTNSAPFETPNGWFIIRRLEFLPQKQLELTDPYRLGQPATVQAYIESQLAQQRESQFISKTFNDLFATLRSQAEIKILGTP